MSLYGALNIGVAGLAANATALSAASSNIANVNTVGYKNETADFSTFLNDIGLPDNASAGVTATIGQDVTSQGLPTATTSPTDLSISGNGFFIVSPNADGSGVQEYTRAGSFTPDASGNLKNAAGLYLMGWKLDSQGATPSNAGALSLINTSSLTGKAQGTSTLSLEANLQSSATQDASYTAGDINAGNTKADFQRTINVYDGQGGSQPLTFSFIKTGANQWSYEVNYAGTASNITGSNPIHQGTLNFNSDGSLANVDGQTPASASMNLVIPWAAASGLSSQTISVNMGTLNGTSGITQFDAASALNGSTADGSSFGSVTGVTIAKDGTVTAQFSNGLSQSIYKIPIASFANADALSQMNGNAYTANKASGGPNINQAGTGAAGTIASQSLEASTVDLATEFTNLITTQRAYSASARIVTTVDQMLQQLEQLPSN